MYIIAIFSLFTVRVENDLKWSIGEITHVNVSFFLLLEYIAIISTCVHITLVIYLLD